MKKFTLSIEVGNDAMRTPEDVARALLHVADCLRFGARGVVRDDNGNAVGLWSFPREADDAGE